MNFPCERISHSEEETKLIAEEFLSVLKPGDVVVLNGDLGTGKTFFIKKITEALGITKANSPTFAIVNEYESGQDTRIYHFDFYRINKVAELHDIGLEDYLADDEAITFIEWGELFPEVLPHKRYEIKIEEVSNEQRKFRFNKFT
ncbi:MULTISPECIES: tRNA (adenosine(37)-N6)-threonylcarbamoyltransferase complex ATPase subunit type 1 TsaE [Ignavibacterium]|jgi:tRNA threonylcarbamoyladenosine biosynthesis protein TsaE|uniref:tRNA (adenosine(37)-N6)-threonylcarbamoyltransferase complex ATPase subunit type 1 TsaE n=1 Tax=Ignavibacterium TaxID=795750 RepID=UPI0025B907CF|nr:MULTISPECIES: tRNA (adenosine(37)-N6)-threonylcarbamoyltransferase complex ATPase subunit type 1 TsaE [Ignavibacterium]MBI5663117.1 tRNA (adenosine(37)-N6)-threonylcarbamoyltransferase complex ATPase subunit type 1 TsaE [Ignavibacterium album]